MWSGHFESNGSPALVTGCNPTCQSSFARNPTPTFFGGLLISKSIHECRQWSCKGDSSRCRGKKNDGLLRRPTSCQRPSASTKALANHKSKKGSSAWVISPLPGETGPTWSTFQIMRMLKSEMNNACRLRSHTVKKKKKKRSCSLENITRGEESFEGPGHLDCRKLQSGLRVRDTFRFHEGWPAAQLCSRPGGGAVWRSAAFHPDGVCPAKWPRSTAAF